MGDVLCEPLKHLAALYCLSVLLCSSLTGRFRLAACFVRRSGNMMTWQPSFPTASLTLLLRDNTARYRRAVASVFC